MKVRTYRKKINSKNNDKLKSSKENSQQIITNNKKDFKEETKDNRNIYENNEFSKDKNIKGKQFNNLKISSLTEPLFDKNSKFSSNMNENYENNFLHEIKYNQSKDNLNKSNDFKYNKKIISRIKNNSNITNDKMNDYLKNQMELNIINDQKTDSEINPLEPDNPKNFVMVESPKEKEKGVNNENKFNFSPANKNSSNKNNRYQKMYNFDNDNDNEKPNKKYNKGKITLRLSKSEDNLGNKKSNEQKKFIRINSSNTVKEEFDLNNNDNNNIKKPEVSKFDHSELKINYKPINASLLIPNHIKQMYKLLKTKINKQKRRKKYKSFEFLRTLHAKFEYE